VGWDTFVELVKVFGLPLTMAFVAIWAFYTDRIYTKRAYDDMVHEKDRQIQREQEGRSELWKIVRPVIQLGRGALDKLERDQEAGGRAPR
jgi:hypothetical protein